MAGHAFYICVSLFLLSFIMFFYEHRLPSSLTAFHRLTTHHGYYFCIYYLNTSFNNEKLLFST